MGPEGGSRGGLVIAEGTPEEVAADATSYTGAFLKPLLDGHAVPIRATQPALVPATRAGRHVVAKKLSARRAAVKASWRWLRPKPDRPISSGRKSVESARDQLEASDVRARRPTATAGDIRHAAADHLRAAGLLGLTGAGAAALGACADASSGSPPARRPRQKPLRQRRRRRLPPRHPPRRQRRRRRPPRVQVSPPPRCRSAAA